MKREQEKADLKRRKFLRGSLATGAGVAAVAVAPGQAMAEATREEESKENKGYRLTEHVLAYYKSAAS